MKRIRFYAALKSTAQVACYFMLVAGLGCGSKVKPVTPVVEVPIAPPKPTPQPTAFEKEQFKQCMSEVANTFSKQNPTFTDRTKECCVLIVDIYEKDENLSMSPILKEDCCDTLDWQGSATCTPWTPPTQPLEAPTD